MSFISATEIGKQLGLSYQKVNKALAKMVYTKRLLDALRHVRWKIDWLK